MFGIGMADGIGLWSWLSSIKLTLTRFWVCVLATWLAWVARRKRVLLSSRYTHKHTVHKVAVTYRYTRYIGGGDACHI